MEEYSGDVRRNVQGSNCPGISEGIVMEEHSGDVRENVQRWSTSARRRHHIPSSDVMVGPDSVRPVQTARVLGVYIDGDMTMTTHINHVRSSCFSALQQIRSIKRSLPLHALHTPVSCTAGWTTVTPCSRVFQPVTFNVCSQCSTPLYDSFPIHQVAVMSHPC